MRESITCKYKPKQALTFNFVKPLYESTQGSTSKSVKK